MFNLIGFEKENNLLLNNYKSKNLHSSIIIHGSKGIGKKLFINNFIGQIFKINFENKNYLHHVNLLKNNTHPNIKVLEKIIDKKTKKIKSNISIDQIRNLKKFLNESSSIKNLDKFIIIDSADDLNLNSANSLLKTLEEPKQNTFIFLISHQISTILPTIRSRCLKIKFNNLNFSDFKDVLNNRIVNITDDEIKLYYDITYGSPGYAIVLHDDNILEYLDITIKSLNSKNIDSNSVNLVNNISKMDNEKFKSYLSILKTILITLNKLKIDEYEGNNFLSNKFNFLKTLSNTLSKQNIIDRFEFLSNNEADLFTYNLDKKLFMLKFLSN